MWLLPVVFMFHDFEEIIMTKVWTAKNAQSIQTRYPKLASRFLRFSESLSTQAFALAVAEEFMILTGLTYIAVERGYYSMWAGIIIGFSVHLIVHIVQFIVYRNYVPAIVTSLVSAIYCIFALHWMSSRNLIVWRDVSLWGVVVLIVIMGNLLLIRRLAKKFDNWSNQQLRVLPKIPNED